MNLLLVGKAAGVVGAVDTDDEVQTVKLGSDKIYSISTSVPRSQEISGLWKAEREAASSGSSDRDMCGGRLA